MKKPGLKTEIVFDFDMDEIVPELNIEMPLKNIKRRVEINIQKTKRHVRDSSINSRLF